MTPTQLFKKDSFTELQKLSREPSEVANDFHPKVPQPKKPDPFVQSKLRAPVTERGRSPLLRVHVPVSASITVHPSELRETN